MFAQDTDKSHFNFSIGTSFGFLSGESEELVYQDPPYSDEIRSQLLWQLRPVIYAGLDLHYDWRKKESDSNISARFFNGFFIDVLFKVGIPGDAGTMRDSDWLNPSSSDQMTNYSVHDNHAKNTILVDIDIGKSIAIYDVIRLKPFISYSFMYYLWSAEGGFGLYRKSGSADYMYFAFPLSEELITYQQSWHIFTPGVSIYGEFNRFFDIELSFKISPFVWVIAVDHHIARDIVFTDYISGGLFIEPSMLFSFRANSFFSLSFSYSYRSISRARGDTLLEQKGYNSEVYLNSAGAGYSAHRAGITAKFILSN